MVLKELLALSSTNLVLGTIEAVPAAALPLDVLLRLTSVAIKTAHGLRWLLLMVFKLHFCSMGAVRWIDRERDEEIELKCD